MQNLIKVNDNAYEIIRTIKVSRVGEDSDRVKAWVDFHHCDRAFKKDEHYYFVRDIIDAEIINTESEIINVKLEVTENETIETAE